MTHDQAHAYCKRLAERLTATAPDRYTTSAALAKRPGRLFIDYLRNGRGTTAIGTYTPRARPGFPIAASVTWMPLKRVVGPDAFRKGTEERARGGKSEWFQGPLLLLPPSRFNRSRQ